MRKAILLLFLGVWLAYLPFHPGHPLTVDSKVTLDTVRAMSSGFLAVPKELVTREGRNGYQYSLYGPLLPIVSLPSHKLVSWIEDSSSEPGSPRISWADWTALGTNQWISALLVALIFRLALLSGVPFFWALAVAAASGFTTMILPYSRDFFTQPLAALCVFCGFQFLWVSAIKGSGRTSWNKENVDSRFRGNGGTIQHGGENDETTVSYSLCGNDENPNLSSPRKRESMVHLGLASFMMGLAVLTRMDMLVVWPGFLVSGFWAIWRGRPGLSWRGIGWLIIPFLLCLASLVVFDWYRWGTWFSNPYHRMPFSTPLIDSLPRFFISHDLSVFLFNPLLIPAFFFLLLTWRDYCWLWSGLLLSSLCYLIFVASYVDYHGGICPGPRYLLILVPVNLLPLVAGLSQSSFRSYTVAIVLVGCGLIGLAMNGYAALVDYSQALPAWDFWMSLLKD